MQYIQSSLLSLRLLRNVANKKLSEVAIAVIHDVQKESSVRGAVIYFPQDRDESKETKKAILAAAQAVGFQQYCCLSNKSNTIFVRSYSVQSDNSDSHHEMEVELTIDGSDVKKSPIFDNPEISPVFHDYKRARLILEKVNGTWNTVK